MAAGVDRLDSLAREGISGARARWNLSDAALYEEAIRRQEGLIAAEGPLVCRTGQHTGRSPNDKFIVREASSNHEIAWGGFNRPISEEQFATLRRDLVASLEGADLFVQDCRAGADPKYRLPIRVVTQYAWHSLFARNLFIADAALAAGEAPQLTIIDAPAFKADPARHGTNSEVVVAVHFGERLVLIAGTSYAGEIKKSVFSTLNYLLPLRDVMPMHCSANVGRAGDVALFFGLSGTGKTTLSSDPDRNLIGDDEHGWSDHGVFNFEGGCYAKVINLSPEGEPDIYRTTQMFGTILENVKLDPMTKKVKFEDQSITENTRASYPLSYIRNHVPHGKGGHPKNIVFLTADAFGVLPPVAKLTREQAMYYFLSGYTAKVAGTERGLTEPTATFSSCFGAVFLVWHPWKYAEMLGKLIDQHHSQVWLVNTGWTGGAAGTGKRMKLSYTRAMVNALLCGDLAKVKTITDENFGLNVPQEVAGVPSEVFRPRDTWSDKAAYDAQAKKLAGMFRENFKRFESLVSDAVKAAGPKG